MSGHDDPQEVPDFAARSQSDARTSTDGTSQSDARTSTDGTGGSDPSIEPRGTGAEVDPSVEVPDEGGLRNQDPADTNGTGVPDETAIPADLQTDWRRLDLKMLLVHPINEVLQFLPAVAAAFFFGSSFSESKLIQIAALVIPILLGLARYITTSYRISPTQIELKRGLLSRKILTAPLDRVRTVELTSPLIHRLLGLAKVQIGTGGGGGIAGLGNEQVVLDSLKQAEARTLRASLLHRERTDPAAPAPEPVPDHVLLRLIPGWAKYAPLTSTGMAIAVAGIAVIIQFGQPFINRWLGDHDGDVRLGATVIAWVVVGLLVLFAVASAVLAVVAYLVTNWNFTVTRDASGRSFQITRGALTTRETSLDIARVHGVQIKEPVALRTAKAGQLQAIATGLGALDDGSSIVVPPAPINVVEGVGELMLAEDQSLHPPFVGHGPRALRRRWIRGVAGGLVIAGIWSLGVAMFDLPMLVHGAGVIILLACVAMVPDRARRLGHALTPRYVVFRKGSLFGTRTALQRSGIIGWNLEQTWFQRRQGLVTISATTSAGEQNYGVYDVPFDDAVAFTDAATPGLLDEFLVR